MSYVAIGILNPINGTCQTVSYDTSTATASAFTRTGAFEVTVTSACHMNIGDTPTATTDDLYLTPDIPRQFPMKPGDSVAFVKAAGGSAGDAFVTEINP